MLGVLSILLTLFALMFFAYRGVTVLVLAPLLAMTAALISMEVSPFVALSAQFMPAAANYIKANFPVFLAGAIFGKLMGVSGAATAIAHFIARTFGKKHAITAIVLSTALLTYGGVSLFVVVFAIYPIGAMLLREADIPKRLLPGAIALGAFTFTMTALPGTPQIINTLPVKLLGTNTWSAPILGILGAIVMFAIGIWWLKWNELNAAKKNEGYGTHENEGLHELGSDLPNIWVAITPILLVFAINFVLTFWIFKIPSVIEAIGLPAAKEGMPKTIDGTWSVISALAIAIVVVLATQFKFIKNPNKQVFDGAVGGLLPIFNTSSEVGYGGVIQGLAAFSALKAAVIAMAIPALFKVALSTTILAGIVGSSSGGTGIALVVLADELKAMVDAGVNPHAIHRIMIMAAGGLDSLPHCGAIITLLSVCKLDHKQSYGTIAVMTVAAPIAAVLVAILFHLATGLV